MRRFLAVCLTLCALLYGVPSHADNMTLLGVSGGGGGGGGGGCTQATTFLARTSGLSGTESAAYTAMICGMVTDGTWTVFDFLYIFATNTTTTANLNLVSSSFTIPAATGSCTFLADNGYTGDASTCILKPPFTPSTNGVKMTLNSAHIGSCILSASADGATYAMGTDNGTNYQYLSPKNTGAAFYVVNDGTGGFVGGVPSTQGNWTITRTSSTVVILYFNGASIGTYTVTSTALPPFPMFIMALNDSGTATGFAPYQLGAVFGGGALNAGQAANVHTRIQTFLTAVGATGAAGC